MSEPGTLNTRSSYVSFRSRCVWGLPPGEGTLLSWSLSSRSQLLLLLAGDKCPWSLEVITVSWLLSLGLCRMACAKVKPLFNRAVLVQTGWRLCASTREGRGSCGCLLENKSLCGWENAGELWYNCSGSKVAATCRFGNSGVEMTESIERSDCQGMRPNYCRVEVCVSLCMCVVGRTVRSAIRIRQSRPFVEPLISSRHWAKLIFTLCSKFHY